MLGLLHLLPLPSTHLLPPPGCRSSVGMVGAAAAAMLREHTQRTKRTEVRLSGVYMGCVENKNGFWPIRDPASKWWVGIWGGWGAASNWWVGL